MVQTKVVTGEKIDSPSMIITFFHNTKSVIWQLKFRQLKTIVLIVAQTTTDNIDAVCVN